jgi:uncharacterized membrane protein YccC
MDPCDGSPPSAAGRLESAVTAVVDRHPIVFAGLPLSSWAFAIRIWLAVVLALYISFWLELEAPSSAAVTVAILALPTRGQVLEKAVFRLIATVIGVAASIAITGLFVQTGSLLLVAFAAWLGLCVYTVGLLDGNRAYAAALSGYTVAIIAVQQIDNPQHVFESAMARGAAIIVGVLTVTVVNDLLAAPDHHPQLTTQLEALRRRIADYARRVLHGEAMPAMTAAGLLREIVALRPEIGSLAGELSSGPARSAAARNVMVGLVAELFAARALEILPAAAQLPSREQVIAQLERKTGGLASSSDVLLLEYQAKDSEPVAASLSWWAKYLVRTDGEIRRSLDDLSAGKRPPRVWRAPLYRSDRIAAETGVRAAVYFLLAATFFAASGWSSTGVSLSFVAILIGRGATMPDPRAFTTIAFVAAPIVSLMAGILEFVVLDGSTAFPLLAISLAPFMIGAALLMTLPNQLLSALGRFNLIFILALLAPSNPQTYNPQTFLFSALFLLLATSLLFAAQILIPLVSNDRRRQWLQASVRRDLQRLPTRLKQDLAPEEAMFRDADRIARILAADGNAPEYRATMQEVMANFDRAAVLRLCDAELDRLAQGPLRTEVGAAYTSLVKRDLGAIVASAHALNEAASIRNISVADAGAALTLASVTLTSSRPGAEFSAEKHHDA